MAFGCQRDAAESAPVHVGNSVVFRQTFIQECEVGIDNVACRQIAVEQGLYLVPNLGIGLVVSTFARTQQQAQAALR